MSITWRNDVEESMIYNQWYPSKPLSAEHTRYLASQVMAVGRQRFDPMLFPLPEQPRT